MTLDGREVVKGPFTEKPKSMRITVQGGKYVLDDGGKKTTYSIRRTGSRYVLTGARSSRGVTITLSNVVVKDDTLRFTSTRLNRPRQERYVVRWECSRVGANPQASLPGTRWRLAEIAYGDDRVVRPMKDDVMTLEFSEGGRVTGQAALNRFQASCKLSPPGRITVGPIAITRAAVPDGSIADTYIGDLQSVTSYVFDRGDLYLVMPVDVGTLRFRRVFPTPAPRSAP